MDENIELLQYIYQNSEMGTYSCTKLIRDIGERENKIKKTIEDILKEYEKYYKESKRLIKKYGFEVKGNSLMTKLSSKIGMKMEVDKDNSDTNISHLLIEGLTMGIVDISTKIDRYKNSVDKKIIKLCKNYLEFQQDTLEELKKYL